MIYAVVTGASQGMGAVIAEKLLSEGCAVAVCARNAAKLETLAAKWRDQWPAAHIVVHPADLSTTDGVAGFAASIAAHFPQVDLLVNNAGAYQPGTIADEAAGQLEKMIGVNLYSAYRLTRQLLPAMKARQSGHIFNMCSIASLKAYPNGGSYSISKYALLGFSENLREELKTEHIKVTAICPGATYTPSWEGSGVAADRIMESADIAHMLWSAFRLSPQANVETIVLRPVKGDL